MKYFLLTLLALLASHALAEAEVEYRTGGKPFSNTWQQFYVVADHEPEIDDPLIAAGQRMVPAICEAISHPDMKRRRYAISALGYIGDARALPSLESILRNAREIDYFRGDALKSIYQIDKALGTRYASQFRNQNGYLSMIATAIARKEVWLTEPSEE